MSTATARRNDRFSKSISDFDFNPRNDSKSDYSAFLGHKTAIGKARSRSPPGEKKKGRKSVLSDTKLDELFSKSCGHFMTNPDDLLADDDDDDELELENDGDYHNASTVASPTSVMADSSRSSHNKQPAGSGARDIAKRQQRQSIALARIPNRGLSRANSCDRGSIMPIAAPRGGRRPGRGGGERQRRPEDKERQRSSRKLSGDGLKADKPQSRRQTLNHLDEHFSKSYSGGFDFEPSLPSELGVVESINNSKNSNNDILEDDEGSLNDEEVFSEPDFDGDSFSEDDEEATEDAIRRFSKSFAGFEMSPRDLVTKSRKPRRTSVSKEAPARPNRRVSRHQSADGPISRSTSRPERPRRREPTERGVGRCNSGLNMTKSGVRRTKSDDDCVANRRKSISVVMPSSHDQERRIRADRISSRASGDGRQRSPNRDRLSRGDRSARPTRSGDKPRIARAHTSEGMQRRPSKRAVDPENVHRRAVAHMLLSDEKTKPMANNGSV